MVAEALSARLQGTGDGDARGGAEALCWRVACDASSEASVKTMELPSPLRLLMLAKGF